jgi:hypothetical protein
MSAPHAEKATSSFLCMRTRRLFPPVPSYLLVPAAQGFRKQAAHAQAEGRMKHLFRAESLGGGEVLLGIMLAEQDVLPMFNSLNILPCHGN